MSPGAGAQSPAPTWSRILPLCKVRAPKSTSQLGKIYKEISHPLKIKQLTKWMQQLFACRREHFCSVSAALWNVRLRGLVIPAWTMTGKSRIWRRGLYISRSACLLSLCSGKYWHQTVWLLETDGAQVGSWAESPYPNPLHTTALENSLQKWSPP